MNFANDDRAPLLLIGGDADHVSPESVTGSNFHKHYRNSSAVTDLKAFPGRSHYTVGQEGWEEVADIALDWALKAGGWRRTAGARALAWDHEHQDGRREAADQARHHRLGVASGRARPRRAAARGRAWVDALPDARTAVVFADDAAALRETLADHAGHLTAPRTFWVAYPKAGRSDINRDSVWPIVGEHGLRPNGQVAIDDVWSALRFRPLAEGEAPFTGGRT